MGFLECSFEELLLFPEDLFGHIPGISTTAMQPRNSPGTHVQYQKKRQTLPEMLIYWLSERRY